MGDISLATAPMVPTITLGLSLTLTPGRRLGGTGRSSGDLRLAVLSLLLVSTVAIYPGGGFISTCCRRGTTIDIRRCRCLGIYGRRGSLGWVGIASVIWLCLVGSLILGRVSPWDGPGLRGSTVCNSIIRSRHVVIVLDLVSLVSSICRRLCAILLLLLVGTISCFRDGWRGRCVGSCGCICLVAGGSSLGGTIVLPRLMSRGRAILHICWLPSRSRLTPLGFPSFRVGLEVCDHSLAPTSISKGGLAVS